MKLKIFKKFLVVLTICLCFSMTTSVFADYSIPLYKIINTLFNIQPQNFSEDNGIRVEVESASINNGSAEIYFTMRDLTDKNRIDETTDLFDSYYINLPSQIFGCQHVDYDENTKTAKFLITADNLKDENFSKSEVTLSFNKFLSHKKTYDDILIPIDLSSVSSAEKTQAVFTTGGSGEGFEEYMLSKKTLEALVPTSPIPEFPVDGIDLTGIGYINDKLHIQTAFKDPLNHNSHGFFYLKDSAGNKIESCLNFSFSNQCEGNNRTDYNNDVFDVSKESVADCKLYGWFVDGGDLIEGDWKVTFNIK